MTVETINTLAIEVDEEKGVSDVCEVPVCRICLQEEIDMDSLISPCQCSGSSKYVHRECLNEWRRMSRNPIANTQCMICTTTYQLIHMSHHYFHEACISIQYNVFALFVYHQLLSIVMTLVYVSTQPIRISQSQYDSRTTSSNSEHVLYSTLTVYIFNIVALVIPMLLYTGYVFARYARNKNQVLLTLCNDGLPTCLSTTFCAACTYLVIPEFVLISIVLLTWTIDATIMLMFEKIEKTNRRYPQEIILNMGVP